MSDSIDAALNLIDNGLRSCAARAQRLRPGAGALATDSTTYRGLFADEGGPLWGIFSSCYEVGDIALAMTHDAQLAVTDGYLRRALQLQSISNLVWEGGNLRFKAVPVSHAEIDAFPGSGFRHSHAVLRVLWDVSINETPPERLQTLLEFRFDIRGQWPKVGFVISRFVSFRDSSGKEADLLGRVPYGKSARVNARREIARQLDRSFQDMRFELPAMTSIPLELKLIPLTSIARGVVQLVFKIEGLPTRRAPYALSSYRPQEPEDMHIRIKSDVLLQKLNEALHDIPGASLQNARFDGRLFRFTIHVYRKERECIAEARIHAWIDYYARVLATGKTALTFQATQLNWHAKWEIDWCFHKCDEASDKIRDTLRSTIPTYASKSVAIGNLSSVANRARGWMDAFGLNIVLETKQ